MDISEHDPMGKEKQGGTTFLALSDSLILTNEGNQKQKRAIKTKQHLSENVLLDSTWIVRWMQEAKPIFEGYTRKNRLNLPQFSLTKYKVKIKSNKVKKKREMEQ
ncbi:hypothetical protein PVK06_010989 [Gossypium arboreum]|uniref:Uncharacterized protein n=1 Tax=Gossypium arboreum TaxID=29729 RepID=A0ABR0Q7T2_GOSAR|nr:hypothetical protein PVK06_010989 [Gossypium arboreum]